MWGNLWDALALVLVIEGMLPFISPQRFRVIMQTLDQIDNRTLRIVGLVSMCLGVLLLYL